MGVLTKEEIMALDDRGKIEFHPEGWPEGADIFLRPMPMREFEALVADKKDEDNIDNYQFMAPSIVDAQGNPMFSVEEAKEVFGGMAMRVQRSIVQKILEINGMKEEVAADVAKKSVETLTSDSPEG